MHGVSTRYTPRARMGMRTRSTLALGNLLYGAPLVAAKFYAFFSTLSFRLLESSAHRCQIIFSHRLFLI